MMNSGEMVNWLREARCDSQTLEQILARNPAKLYRF
jgi:hypothetical protein